ncbi:hypothetical protein N5D04_16865, partial [Stenotrophomonas sp. GD03882]
MDPIDGHNKASAYPVTCTYLPEWGYRQGCALHPPKQQQQWGYRQGCALHPPKQQQQPKQQHKLVSCGMAGWVRLRGS